MFNSTRRTLVIPVVKCLHVHCVDFEVTITNQSFWVHWFWCPKSELLSCVLMFQVAIKKKHNAPGHVFI